MLLTIGHGTHPIETFLARLAENDVTLVIDVRAFPASRHNPQFNGAELERSLAAAGVGYRWAQALGGRRRPDAASVNIALRHPSFRAYADHMSTAAFWVALDDVLADASNGGTTVMCSESVWWKCHRRLIADAAQLVRHDPVAHIMPNGILQAHILTDVARVDGDRLVYDGRAIDADDRSKKIGGRP